MRNIFAPVLRSVYAQPTGTLTRRVVTRGACVGTKEPDAWFPPEPTPQRNEPVEALIAKREQYEALAQQLCKPCPVRAECLELALREEAQLPRTWLHGIRGGTAPWQRLNLIVQRRRATKKAGDTTAVGA
ncbi:UNVERIFIED_ORG: hypothetical protein FHR35_002718 [Microbispora rosea subsp. rosea]